MAVASAALVGCASKTDKRATDTAPILFPAPPEEARYAFEMTLMTSAQVNKVESISQWRRALTGETEGGEYLGKPFDVSVCRGVVYVSDTVQRRIVAFDFPGRRYFRIGEADPGALLKPLGVATDDECRVYVADTSHKKVFVYDRSGKYLTSVGDAASFRHLSHVAVQADGSRVFMVDTGGVDSRDHRIRVYSVSDGKHLYDIGARGTEPGTFNLPRDVEVTRDGHLYVVDGGNFRVQVFRLDGTFVRTFGAMGAQFGQFTRPKGIAVDAQGNIFVADAAFGNFQIFDPEGRLLLFIGGRANQPGPGKYMLPAGIDVDEDGRVYLVDQFFRKVDVFRPVGLAQNMGHLARRDDSTGKTDGAAGTVSSNDSRVK